MPKKRGALQALPTMTSASMAFGPLGRRGTGAGARLVEQPLDGRGARDLVQVMALLLGEQDIVQVDLDQNLPERGSGDSLPFYQVFLPGFCRQNRREKR